MQSRKLKISLLLMLLAIFGVAGFQSYWLWKTFKEEEQTLRIRSNIVFRETLFQIQADVLQTDSALVFKSDEKNMAGRMINILHARKWDSSINEKERRTKMAIELAKAEPRPAPVQLRTGYSIQSTFKMEGDSSLSPTDISSVQVRRDGNMMLLLRGIDSLREKLQTPDVVLRVKQHLEKENLPANFHITRRDTAHYNYSSPAGEEKVFETTVGYTRPVTFGMELMNLNTSIMKRLWPQLLVSFLLIGITIFSFTQLFRSLVQQQRLALIKNEFISNITHELKTPIATVSVAIEALKSFNAMENPARTKEYLDISGNELQRLSLLVDKVLKLSMFEKQQIELQFQSFDFRQLVEEVTGSMRLQVEKFQAKLSTTTLGDNFVISGDRLHITSVLFNLIDNALKYSKANPSIQIDIKEIEFGVVLTVTDNGVGIPEEYTEKIFDKFFRVPSNNTHNVKGYGLGLSYVAYVVTAHKGSIEVQSTPGIGSRFMLKFPR